MAFEGRHFVYRPSSNGISHRSWRPCHLLEAANFQTCPVLIHPTHTHTPWSVRMRKQAPEDTDLILAYVSTDYVCPQLHTS